MSVQKFIVAATAALSCAAGDLGVVTQVAPQEIVLESNASTLPASGLVIRRFGTKAQMIVAQITSFNRDGTTVRAVWAPYQGTRNTAMPQVKPEPVKGDTVIDIPYGRRALIVAPTQKLYQESLTAHPELEFVHPDLLAAALSTDAKPLVEKEDFRNFCTAYGIGKLIFTFDATERTVDCLSFSVTATRPASALEVNATTKSPFFHRTGEIKRGFFNFGAKDIGDFAAYYRKMLGV